MRVSAKYSIGIDLGTTNCAMAFTALERAGAESEVFAIPQFESLGSVSDSPTLPSFLYRLAEHESPSSNQLAAGDRSRWVAGRMARKKSAENPGRVVHSAKSWLGHHAVDRDAAFLPWRSDELAAEERISPIHASALLLGHLRNAWDTRFGAEAPFDFQEITITVPASFDAAAQRLTLAAAEQSGYPKSVRLLEEPQAAFYRWLELHRGKIDLPEGAHVVVVDIGGGTSDFSLFEIRRSGSSLPQVKRVAVSDHLLLGGDNIDLAIAHRLEPRFGGEGIAPAQWNLLAARCRDLKERCLADAAGEIFPVSLPGRGSGLFGGTLTAKIERKEIEAIVLDGFFPVCDAEAKPDRAQAGLREWALPYAADSAVTRYLAEFLRDRPPVDAVLFNGGSLYPEMLRRRLREQIGMWQQGKEPIELENREPDLAVARGAARFGSVLNSQTERIEAGAARAIYLEVHQQAPRPGAKPASGLVCILPRDAAAEQEFKIENLGLELRLNRLVRFQPYSSARRSKDAPGVLVALNERDFRRLPPLRTVAKLGGKRAEGDRLPVTLTARVNELGLLQIACASADPRIKQSWPLEFDLRPHEQGEEEGANDGPDTGVAPERFEAAAKRIATQFAGPLNPRDKLTANNLLKNLEQILGMPKAEWTGQLVRSLWAVLNDCFECRKNSVDHEEAWLILAGYFLRPGFGATGDDLRMEQLWKLRTAKPAFPGKRTEIQQFVLWRRVAGGLDQERQKAILKPELLRLQTGKNASPELVRLAGALERVDVQAKIGLAEAFLKIGGDLARNRQHCAPYLVSLGLLLNRTPLYAGPESVLPADLVQQAFEVFQSFDWSAQELLELQTLFLRAARVTDQAQLDVPKQVRSRIASKLEDSGVPPLKAERVRKYVPLERSEQTGLFGEALPPGLTLKP